MRNRCRFGSFAGFHAGRAKQFTEKTAGRCRSGRPCGSASSTCVVIFSSFAGCQACSPLSCRLAPGRCVGRAVDPEGFGVVMPSANGPGRSSCGPALRECLACGFRGFLTDSADLRHKASDGANRCRLGSPVPCRCDVDGRPTGSRLSIPASHPCHTPSATLVSCVQERGCPLSWHWVAIARTCWNARV
jgi:hypothetical protein